MDEPQAPVTETIRTKHLVLVDPQGRDRISLECWDDVEDTMPAIRMYRADGTEAIRIKLAQDQPVIELRGHDDAEGFAKIRLALDQNDQPEVRVPMNWG